MDLYKYAENVVEKMGLPLTIPEAQLDEIVSKLSITSAEVLTLYFIEGRRSQTISKTLNEEYEKQMRLKLKRHLRHIVALCFLLGHDDLFRVEDEEGIP